MFGMVSRHAGWVEVICGSMFSGKTEELIRRLKRAEIGRLKVQCFKPAIDNRYSKENVTSHNDSQIRSRPIDKSWQILELIDDNTRVVGIDEVQFFDDSVVEVCQKLANRGIQVIVAGLDMDYKGEPFEPLPRLLAIAESVTKLNAICVQCGQRASLSQRLVDNSDRIAVGGTEIYEARCRACHEVPKE